MAGYRHGRTNKLCTPVNLLEIVESMTLVSHYTGKFLMYRTLVSHKNW